MKPQTGIGLRTTHYAQFLNDRPQVPWLEVITENFLGVGGRPQKVLQTLAHKYNYPIAFHGVGLSIGSQDPLRMEYFKKMSALIGQYQPFVVSDHLSWSRHRGQTSHDLLPMPYTYKELNRVSGRIAQAQDILGRSLAFENPSAYLTCVENEMTESEFIREVCLRTGAQLLLDVNNLVVNKYNLGFDAKKYLEDIKNVDVAVIHIAGHIVGESGMRIDTHNRHPDPEALDLLKLAKQIWPHAKPLLEWDDDIPPLQELIGIAHEIDHIIYKNDDLAMQAQAAALIYAQHDIGTACLSHDGHTVSTPYHDAMWSIVTSYVQSDTDSNHVVSDNNSSRDMVDHSNLFTNQVRREAGVQIYRSGYFIRIEQVLRKMFPTLAVVSAELFTDLVKKYLQHCPPTEDSIDCVGEMLPTFLQRHPLEWDWGVEQEVIYEIALFESTYNQLYLAADDSACFIEFNYKVCDTVSEVKAGHVPEEPPAYHPHNVLFKRCKDTVEWLVLTPEQADRFKNFKHDASHV